jgi:hypothetical protein
VSLCVLITLFARYADSERFPLSAYLNIGLTYLLSLSSLGLLGIDLAFTLKDRAQGIDQKVFETETGVLWNIVYWGSLVSGTVFSTFFTRYWQSGHFSITRRVIHALKVLSFVLVISIIDSIETYYCCSDSIWNLSYFDLCLVETRDHRT